MYHQYKHAYITFDTARIELLEYSLRRKTNGMITKRSVYQTTNLRVIDTEFLWLSWFANHHLLNLCSPCKTIWRSELLLINIYSGFKCKDNWLWQWMHIAKKTFTPLASHTIHNMPLMRVLTEFCPVWGLPSHGVWSFKRGQLFEMR